MCHHIWNSVFADKCKFVKNWLMQCCFMFTVHVSNYFLCYEIRIYSVPERSFKYFLKIYLLYIQLIVLFIMCSVITLINVSSCFKSILKLFLAFCLCHVVSREFFFFWIHAFLFQTISWKLQNFKKLQFFTHITAKGNNFSLLYM